MTTGGIKFCPKCGGIMRPMRINGKLYMICTRCGYKEEVKDDRIVTVYSRSVKIKHTPKEKIIVVDDSKVPRTASLLKGVVRCPKCGSDEVYVWMVQTRSADEPPTRFYKCSRCGYTWREYA